MLTSGCSFIWGSELDDCSHCGPGGFSHTTWPAILATRGNMDYFTVSNPGIGNDTIARNIIEFCERKTIPDIVIVQWTFPWRFGFRFGYPTNKNHDQWYTVDLWSIDDDHKPAGTQISEDDQLFGYSEKMREIAKTVGVKEFANIFYKHVAYDEYWPIYTTLKEIVGLQNYLTVKQIPFLFTCVDNVIFESNTAKTADPYINSLISQIISDNWFMFPAGTKPHQTTTPRGFYQWAEENKYPKGAGGHPLIQAHTNAANLIEEKVNEMVKNHLEPNRSRNSLS